MSAADQQSLNAVKAALQNAQARSEGSVARGRGEQPFVCATVDLLIDDLQAVVSLADDLDKVAAQRDELTAGVEKLTATCNALTDRVKELEGQRDELLKHYPEKIGKLERERDALKADLARVSEELGLPPTIGPAPGEIAKRLLKPGEIAINKADYERLIASLPAGPRAVQ